MQYFTNLISQIEESTSTTLKVEALVRYFNGTVQESDKLWVVYLLSNAKRNRPVKTSLMRKWAAEESDLPSWLVEETYHIVGDLGETLANILEGEPSAQSDISLTEVMYIIESLRKKDDHEKRKIVVDFWKKFTIQERYLFNKLIGGSFRIGLSKGLVIKALSKATGLGENIIHHRLIGQWFPSDHQWEILFAQEKMDDDISKQFPFLLAQSIHTADFGTLGDSHQWAVEYKWDGIRAQFVKRKEQYFIWSRGQELITDRFPELSLLSQMLPTGTVLDGEIIAFKDKPLPFQLLQKRINRQTLTKNILQECPIAFMAYDILEFEYQDLRNLSYQDRKRQLFTLSENVKATQYLISAHKIFDDWSEAIQMRSVAEEYKAEGIMIKKLNSPYGIGRKSDMWYKCKLDAKSVDAVLIYAQRGHGRRANLFTDFTFAVWKAMEDGTRQLLPFTKAYSGLTDEEFEQISKYVRKNTIQKFGPVCSVTPLLVMEIAFEGIALSSRHKSGLALRFPRIKAWRKDKKIEEADTVESLLKLIPR